MQKYDVIIIGGGPAGMTAGIYAVRAGLSAAVIEPDFIGGQASTTNWLENYPGFPGGVGGPELMQKFEEQARALGLVFIYDSVKELSLSGDEKRASLQGDEVSAKAVILAMGARRKKLDVPGEAEFLGRGVSYCATCDGHMYKGKTVAVIGGGNSAVEEAVYLSRLSNVLLIHRRDELRATKAEADAALGNPKIEPVWNTIVEKITEGPALHVKSKDAEARTIQVDGIFVSIGTQPNSELLRGQVALNAEGYVLAGEDAKTSIPGVFAAGDIRLKPLRQVVTAVGDGATAANAAAKYIGSNGCPEG